jgi:arsenate reductase
MKVHGIYTCTSFKRALAFFKEKNIEIEEIDFKKETVSANDLKKYHEMSGLKINKFFNTSGKLYRELNLKERQKEMSLDEIYSLLSENPMLIKRPLIVDGNYVRTGFKLEEYEEQWG